MSRGEKRKTKILRNKTFLNQLERGAKPPRKAPSPCLNVISVWMEPKSLWLPSVGIYTAGFAYMSGCSSPDRTKSVPFAKVASPWITWLRFMPKGTMKILGRRRKKTFPSVPKASERGLSPTRTTRARTSSATSSSLECSLACSSSSGGETSSATTSRGGSRRTETHSSRGMTGCCSSSSPWSSSSSWAA